MQSFVKVFEHEVAEAFYLSDFLGRIAAPFAHVMAKTAAPG